jgi:hypothetical protein
VIWKQGRNQFYKLLDTVLDPTFHFDAEQDPDPDPDPTPSLTKDGESGENVFFYNFYSQQFQFFFYLSR